MDIELLLKQYRDACALCEELDEEIERVHNELNTPVSDCVMGSDDQYPYTARKYTVSGIPSGEYSESIRQQEHALWKRKTDALRIKMDAEVFIQRAPLRMQRIIKYRYLQGLTWECVADKMGGRCTANSLRMEWKRFLRECRK